MIKANKIYCENNLETMKRMPDNFVDLTVTSPPYDNLRTYNGYSFEFERVAKELFRVTKKGGVVVWVVGDATIDGSETGTSFRQALYFMECGFKLHDTMIYRKLTPIPLNIKNRYQQCFEYMFVFSKDSPQRYNIIQIPTQNAGKTYRVKRNNATSNGGGAVNTKDKVYTAKDTRNDDNIWELLPVGSLEYAEHPAAYPEELAKKHIYSWSNEGDLIYDPFMGSGTTAKMAHLLKRNWIGSEISQEYVDLANKRLDPYLRQERLAI